MRKKIKVLCLGLIISFTSYSQNTLSYTELESSYNNGVELFEKKAYSSARKEFSKYVANSSKSLNPNKFNISNAEYYSALAALYTKSKDAEIEVERFVLNHSEHPKAKLIYSDLADNAFKNNDYQNAVVYFSKALENRLDNTDSYEIRYKLGMSYYNLKKYPQALTEFNYIKNTATPSAIHAAYYAAVINFQNENFDEALSDLRRVENVNPYKIEVPNWISQILFRQKKYDDLLEYAEPIIANPNGRKIDEICLVAAEVHFFRDNYDRAALYYSKFNELKRGTVNPQITFRHGYSLYKINEFQKAVPIFKKIAANNDEIGQQAAYYLGISSLKSGDLNSAMAAFETAKKMDFDSQIKEEATYNLIKVLVEKNDNTSAINELQNYVKSYPKGKYIDESNELLSEIFFETNNYIAAIKYIESLDRRTSKINDAYQKLCYNQGVNDFNLEKFESAILYFDKALSISNNSEIGFDAKYWKAESLFALNKPESENMYKDLIQSGNDNSKIKSLYSIGYLYYNQKKYTVAQTYFEDFLSKAKGKPLFEQNYEDALVRLADCQLTAKNYQKALDLYEKAYQNNRSDKDYALFQKGVTLRFMAKETEAKTIFEKFAKEYGNSRLIDDALYQNGLIELEKNNYQNAINLFTDLFKKKPNSILVPDALLKRALAFGNIKQYDKAISDYKVIITKFGKSPAAEEALIGVRDVLSMANRTEEFSDIAEIFAKNNPESTSIESLQYETSKNLFYSEKYDKAINSLSEYIKNYPNSSSLMEANYLLAESYYYSNKKKDAIKYYDIVVNDNQNSFVSKSAYRAASISFDSENFDEAIKNYKVVVGTSSNKREIISAWEGLVQSYYLSNGFENSIKYCNDILNDGGNTVIGAQNKAQLYLGKNNMKMGKNMLAIEEFNKTISLAKDVNGAEAKYLIAEIEYKSKQYDQSIKTLQQLAADFSDFNYWYEKAFLLIVDNYLGKNDIFMAKATLNSIIENSENKQTIEEAKLKLKSIK